MPCGAACGTGGDEHRYAGERRFVEKAQHEYLQA
jgi:hypothetical protein